MTHPLNAKKVSVQAPHTTSSFSNNPKIAPMASGLKPFLRNSTNSSFCTVFANPELTRQRVQDDFKTLEHTLESESEGPPSVLVQEQDPTPAPPEFIPELVHNAKLPTMMRQMAHKDAERIHTSGVKKQREMLQKKHF